MKQFLVLLFFLLSIKSNAQKLTLTDLSILINNTTNGAERLLNKGFEETCTSNGGTLQCFELTKAQRTLTVRVHDEDDYCKHHFIEVCFGKSFTNDFQLLNKAILKNGKKIEFLLSSNYSLYFTLYKYQNLFVYVSRGNCFDSIDNFKKYFIICSNVNLTEHLNHSLGSN